MGKMLFWGLRIDTPAPRMHKVRAPQRQGAICPSLQIQRKGKAMTEEDSK